MINDFNIQIKKNKFTNMIRNEIILIQNSEIIINIEF